MKCSKMPCRLMALSSLPARGAWIEMRLFLYAVDALICRSPHGERGLKLVKGVGNPFFPGRSPHGERGLKFRENVVCHADRAVAPRTGSVD